jgi:hypothetical protein
LEGGSGIPLGTICITHLLDMEVEIAGGQWDDESGVQGIKEQYIFKNH